MTTNFTFNNQIFDNYGEYTYAIAIEESYKNWASNVFYIIIIVFFMFVVGVIGNSLTIAVILLNKSMRTTTNYYLLNLAAADLMFLVFVFSRDIHRDYRKIARNVAMCIFEECLWLTLIYASVTTIVVLSVERYIAICKPFKFSSKSHIFPNIIGTWSVAIICAYVEASRQKYNESDDRCYYETVDVLIYLRIILFVIFFGLPMLVLIVLYTLIGVAVAQSNKIKKNIGPQKCNIKNSSTINDSTKKTLKMLVTIVIIFFLCWAPFYLNKATDFGESYFYLGELSAVKFFIVKVTLIILEHLLPLLSAAINPIIYSIMSKKFKDAFKEIIKNLCRTICITWSKNTGNNLHGVSA